MILLTNFLTVADDSDLDVVIENIQNAEIELIAVSDSVSYSNNDDHNSCNFTQDPNKKDNQLQSEKIFEEMVNNIEGACLCHIDYVEEQLHYFQKKATRAHPWNVALTIGSEFSINVSAFVYIQDEKFFTSFKTRCFEDNTATKMVTEYTKNNEVIEKPDIEDLLKAYAYGSKLVALDEPDAIYKSGSKCLKCLAFTKRKNLAVEYFAGKGSHIIVPQKGFEKSSMLFALLIKAMMAKDYAMIARKVYRENTKVSIVALIPRIEEEGSYLIMIELPFAEDLKYLAFPKLNSKSTEPNDEQMKAMSKLIDSMDLMKAIDDDSGISEAFKYNTTLNPFHQHMCRTIAHRALNPNEPLQPVDDELMKIIDVPEKIKIQSKDVAKDVERLFPVEIVEFKVKKPFGQKSVYDTQTQNILSSMNTDEDDIEHHDDKAIVAVGSATPCEDFLYLVRKSSERFSVLCEQMHSIIYELLFKSTSDLSEKIKECVMVLRESSKINSPFTYNKWLNDIKETMVKRNKLNEWDNIFVKEGFGLITINESPISTITIEEQLEFYEINKKSGFSGRTSMAVDDEDDLEDLL
jgi:ATP-dependent DNA helicase 2 subunit 2